MLVISNYKKGDTVCIKLSTGEEVVARFHSSDADMIKVIKPTVITLSPQSGQAMLIPWLMSIDTTSSDPVDIHKVHVVATNKPNKSLSDGYMQSTTGIASASPAEASLIL